MGFDISIPGLRLGLGLGLHDHDEHKQRRQRQKKKEADPCNKAYPSLTLGPPPDDDVEANNNEPISKTESDEYYYFHPHASSPSAVSSFSNSCIKRDRDQFAGEEVEKILSRVVDVHENGNPNKKLRLTKQQSAILEDSFKQHSTLTPKQKQELAKKLNLRPRQVEVWFQNRRARTKLKETEVECELLKKWCESLREEKKMLQKELEELKLMKARVGVGPYYMQLPVASLTICPSCDKIYGGSGATKNGSSPTTPLLLGPKAHHSFYKSNYTFTQSSAAC
ncbi:homeobox-leucine zipper protein HOX15 [Cajanus cajan]|uniref:Homeobox-leucine zipper protein HOX19 n=1 Tax=Cajanus cajan TaxID=3821 RepID=A0A151TTF7_CAJCA|nr:homeobox-leucine zipper protein HOX15 [Cajanus cajan]KYP70362.1 Homeobox-leucine zipper protein HOX19 [Cajanus cajan]